MKHSAPILYQLSAAHLWPINTYVSNNLGINNYLQEYI